jgi:protein SCO1
LKHFCLVLCVLAVCASAGDGRESLFRPLPNYPIKPFTLTDQDGKEFSSDILRGKVWVAHFFYSDCSEGCGITERKMKEFQNLVRGKPDILLVSIDLNEESPEVLRSLATALKAESGQWYFLTGPKKQVFDLVRNSFMFAVEEYKDKPADKRIGHTFNLCVVDREGRECGYVEGKDENTVGDLLSAVRGAAASRYLLSNVNALLNFLSGVLLVLGYVAIRRKQLALHKACMLSALASSTVFLGCYLYYHFAVLAGQPPRFVGSGVIWYVYIAILLSHTILAAVVAPLAVTVAYLGLRNKLARHVRIARWTLPIWLYVSATGVVVYLMLYRLYPPF